MDIDCFMWLVTQISLAKDAGDQIMAADEVGSQQHRPTLLVDLTSLCLSLSPVMQTSIPLLVSSDDDRRYFRKMNR